MSNEIEPRHPVTLVVALSIIAAALGGAMYMMRRADARVSAMNAGDAVETVPVDVYVLEPVDVPRLIETRGFLSGIEEITVRSEVAGRVAARAVGEGDRVEAGDVILTIDDTFYALAVQRSEAELRRAQAAVGEARAAVTQAEAQLESAKAVLANSATELERIEKLYASDNAPPIEHDRIVMANRTAHADHAAAQAALTRALDQRALSEATVQSAQAALGEAQAHLERCTVRAPTTGRINRIYVEPGEYAVTTAPLAEIVRLDRMKMNVELADTKIRLLENFTRAEVTADAIGGAPHRAALHHIAPKMDPVSRKFQVELRVDNDDEALLSGMYGEAVLHAGAWRDVMRLPREAIFKHFGVDHCLVVDDSGGTARAKLQRVEVRAIEGRLDDVEVVSGLSAGARVVVSRRRELHDGVPVSMVRTIATGASTTATP